MMKIVYDPKEGQVVSDANIEDFYAMYCRYARNPENENIKVSVGSETIVMRFRLGVALGEIPTNQIEFWFNDEQIEMTSFGSFNGMPPEGYCDYVNGYVRQLSKKRRASFEAVK